MDNRFYDNVIGEMKSFFDENGFKENEDGSFANETKSVRVEYNEERQMYLLKLADIEDGKTGEYAEASAWLFDDTQIAADAESVGIDFTNTLRDNMGIKVHRAGAENVDLPSAEKSGALTIPGFTKKVLDVFPQYKESYKEHIAKYGNFLYLDFFGETLVPQIKTILEANSKKQVKKLFELLDLGYIQGDRETVNAMVIIVCAAVYQNDSLKAKALEMLEADKHFQNSVSAFIPFFAGKKKLREVIIK